MALYNRNCEVINYTIFDGPNIEEIRQHKWCLNQGYVITKIQGKTHNLSNFTIGDFNREYVFDHKNWITINNLMSNLRIATHSQNRMNRDVRSNNATGVTGVHFDNRCGKYCARISVNRKRKHLGYFTKLQDAKTARCNAERIYHGEFSPNFKKEAQHA